ncbi:MAG: Gfo/Idh/MocA family oxidoreductase [Phycisphaerae bacterium]
MKANQTAATAAVAAAGLAGRVHAAGSGTLKIGLVGTGGRGTRDVSNCARAADGVVIWALGDLFEDRVRACHHRLKQSKQLGPQRFHVPDDRCFHGWDNHQRVIDAVDVVLFCQPPGFRPVHLRAAVEAGKHVFAEKPVAVCPAGVRHIIESAEMAERKGLGFVAGTQTRHSKRAIETVKRIHDGAIGRITHGACYFLTGELWHRGEDPNWSEMEYQCRNWYYFNWLSGDHIVEQHIHQHDIMNWVMQANPLKAYGTGGRQVRTAEKWGNIWDHFGVEYEYPGGVRIHSLCRQADNTAHRVDAYVIGSKGAAFPSSGKITGENAWSYEAETPDPSVQEHKDLIESIRAGKPLNEGRRIAESTMVAVFGRMSAYTGREVSWKWAMEASKRDLMPTRFEFGPNPVPPVAVPGKTKLV